MSERRVLGAATSSRRAVARTWRAVMAHRIGGRVVKVVLFAVGTYLFAKGFFRTGNQTPFSGRGKPPPDGLLLYAAALGALYGLIAAGVILIYRTNRIVNFAAASMGSAPAVFALVLFVEHGLPFLLAIPLALVGGVVVGGTVDAVVIRRFSTAPRLILTVVTIGVSQLLAFISFLTPTWLGVEGMPDLIRTPWRSIEWEFGGTFITMDYVVAAIGVAIMAALLAAFFRFTRMGIAVRASAENADRASLLGIPVKRVEMVAWAIAGLFSTTTVFLRAPLVGLPLGGLNSVTLILYALAAAVIARMESIPVAIAAGIGIGIIDQSSVYSTGKSSFATALMLIVILVAFLVQKGTLSRAYDTGVSTWQAVRELRPVPPELRNVQTVRNAKAALIVVVAALLLTGPYIVGEANRGLATLVLIYGMVGVSLVILTGWAGQISLGQFAFAGVGALVGGGLAADHNIDFFAAIVIGGLAGAVAAILIGLPALRIQGLFLAVTTLAFAAATEFYVMSPEYPIGKALLPDSGNRVLRPILWERIDVRGETAFYYVCLVFLGLMIAGATAFRKNRSGRVLIACRDNPRAASAYAINLARSRLAAFAISGFIAAVAGVLLSYQAGAVDAGQYGPSSSIVAFICTVVGGLTSVAGAILGAVVIQGIKYFQNEINIANLELLVTGPGLILVLQFLPGGFIEGLYRVRDNGLRWVANRENIHVPSLVADKLVETGEEEQHIVTEAEQTVEEAESFDILGERTIACPVCADVLSLEDAAEHEHLKVPPSPEVAAAGNGESDENSAADLDIAPATKPVPNGARRQSRVQRAREGRRS